MCGICGYVGGGVNSSCLSAMVRSIGHRGPDAKGEYLAEFTPSPGSEPMQIGLGHCRLSIIDLSDAGSQPMCNEDETVWIVFNGEIYNFIDLKRGLEKRGHRFRSRSDTEVILHLYEEKEEACLDDLQGMFAFAIWDRKKKKLFLARDRVGIKPLYFWAKGDNLFFASELKALLKSDGCPHDLDPEALALFTTFLYVPSPLTIFRSVKKLPPGHFLIWERGKIATCRYWKPESASEEIFEKPDGAIEEVVFRRLEETVGSHLISDVPLGVFLSGGMDSGAIVGLMSRVSGQRVKTFSIGYGPEASSYNELAYSRILADHFKTEHYEYILKPDVVELLPRIVWHMDEPFADSSAIPNYLISRVASRHVKVALSGVGGDELFGGYPRYLGAHLSTFYQRLPARIRSLLRAITSGFPESTSSGNTVGRMKRFFRGATLPREECYLRWVSFLAPEQAKDLFSADFSKQIQGLDLFERGMAHLARSLAPEDREWVSAVQWLDIMTYLPDDLLTMCDKMSMASSLEVRVPFCDHLLVQSMMAIPSKHKYKGLKLKSLMKSSFKTLLPKEIIQHKKQGFMVPLAVWLKSDLRPLIEDLLSKERIERRGFFRYSFVRRMLDLHYSGRENLVDSIYALVVLELWHQLYLD